MKNLVLAGSAALLLLVPATFIIGQTRARNSYVPNELLVKFAPGVKKNVAAKTMQFAGANVVETLGDLGWVRVRLPTSTSVRNAVANYAGLRDVIAVQPNYYYRLLNTPNDPRYLSGEMYGLSRISAPAAWDITTGSPTVVVADIDTGMRYTHEDLAPNVWTNPGEIPNNGIDDDGNGFVDDYHGFDFRFNDPDPIDEHGHGTHTAGTIGAAGNNALGVVGVNWNVKIMAIKIYSAAANDTTSAMLINAYNYVRMMKDRGVNIRVTNNSYGGPPETASSDLATKDALDAMGSAGILNVFAAGNSNSNNDINPFYPASYSSPSILAVAASDPADNKAGFSNYGPATVDIAAPGAGILSTTAFSDSSYGGMSGTSMATPHVAGAAALLSSLNPGLSAASLKATLMNTVDILPQWNGLVRSGGRLNIANALQNQTVCSYQLTSNSVLAPTKGGYLSVDVTAPQSCDFSVKSSAYWIHVNTGDLMSGNSTITFRVTLNPTVTREGTITIAGQAFTVRQSRIPVS
jgi:subtilisin family serine protease